MEEQIANEVLKLSGIEVLDIYKQGSDEPVAEIYLVPTGDNDDTDEKLADNVGGYNYWTCQPRMDSWQDHRARGHHNAHLTK